MQYRINTYSNALYNISPLLSIIILLNGDLIFGIYNAVFKWYYIKVYY